MKKVVMILAILAVSFAGYSQTGTSKAVPYQKAAKGIEKAVRDTTINGNKYPIYQGTRGGNYMYVTSKTGNIYKKYIKAN